MKKAARRRRAERGRKRAVKRAYGGGVGAIRVPPSRQARAQPMRTAGMRKRNVTEKVALSLPCCCATSGCMNSLLPRSAPPNAVEWCHPRLMLARMLLDARRDRPHHRRATYATIVAEAARCEAIMRAQGMTALE